MLSTLQRCADSLPAHPHLQGKAEYNASEKSSKALHEPWACTSQPPECLCCPGFCKPVPSSSPSPPAVRGYTMISAQVSHFTSFWGLISLVVPLGNELVPCSPSEHQSYGWSLLSSFAEPRAVWPVRVPAQQREKGTVPWSPQPSHSSHQ